MSSIFQMSYRFLTDPTIRFRYLSKLGFYNAMSDEKYIKRLYKIIMGKPLDLDNPKTFNEKLQWLKIHERKKEYTMMVDKYKVREYIKEKLGEEYLIPLIGVWERPSDIDFDKLPNQFVLKCNHNSGLGLCICKDKGELNIKKVKKELGKGLKENYYLRCREWPYKNVSKKIICEQFMEDKPYDVLPVYKILCFHGVAKIIQFIKNDTKPNETVDYYDTNWKKLDLKQDFPNSDIQDKKPECLQKMIQIAEQLSKNIKFLRVDFYIVAGKIKFSECTFYSDAGFGKFDPISWDNTLGDWLDLS